MGVPEIVLEFSGFLMELTLVNYMIKKIIPGVCQMCQVKMKNILFSDVLYIIDRAISKKERK